MAGLPPLTNNTAKTSFGEDLVKIRPAVAEQSRQKKKNTKRPLNIRRRLHLMQRAAPSNKHD